MDCRDSFGTFNASVFNIWTCSLCYSYLFPNSDFKKLENVTHPGLKAKRYISYYPDVKYRATLEPMCSDLGTADCNRWKDCCTNAVRCCERQTANKSLYLSKPVCPSTWDGWACFDDTVAGATVKTPCPNFIKFGNLEGR